MLALLVQTACDADSTDNRQSEPPVPTITAIDDAGQLTMPLDSYLLIFYQWGAPDRALNLLGRQCMRRFELDWPINQTVWDVDRPDHSRLYGLLDLEGARTNGYVNRSAKDAEVAVDADRQPTDEELMVWAGEVDSFGNEEVPEDGCVGEATRRLREGAPPAPQIDVQQLIWEASTRAERDSRVVSAFEAWSACMSSRGYTYETPWLSNDDPRWVDAAGSPRPSDQEIQVAVADVECKLETNLVGIWHAVEVAYQERLIEEHALALEELKAHSEAVIDNAARIVKASR